MNRGADDTDFLLNVLREKLSNSPTLDFGGPLRSGEGESPTDSRGDVPRITEVSAVQSTRREPWTNFGLPVKTQTPPTPKPKMDLRRDILVQTLPLVPVSDYTSGRSRTSLRSASLATMGTGSSRRTPGRRSRGGPSSSLYVCESEGRLTP